MKNGAIRKYRGWAKSWIYFVEGKKAFIGHFSFGSIENRYLVRGILALMKFSVPWGAKKQELDHGKGIVMGKLIDLFVEHLNGSWKPPALWIWWSGEAVVSSCAEYICKGDWDNNS